MSQELALLSHFAQGVAHRTLNPYAVVDDATGQIIDSRTKQPTTLVDRPGLFQRMLNPDSARIASQLDMQGADALEERSKAIRDRNLNMEMLGKDFQKLPPVIQDTFKGMFPAAPSPNVTPNTLIPNLAGTNTTAQLVSKLANDEIPERAKNYYAISMLDKQNLPTQMAQEEAARGRWSGGLIASNATDSDQLQQQQNQYNRKLLERKLFNLPLAQENERLSDELLNKRLLTVEPAILAAAKIAAEGDEKRALDLSNYNDAKLVEEKLDLQHKEKTRRKNEAIADEITNTKHDNLDLIKQNIIGELSGGVLSNRFQKVGDSMYEISPDGKQMRLIPSATQSLLQESNQPAAEFTTPSGVGARMKAPTNAWIPIIGDIAPTKSVIAPTKSAAVPLGVKVPDHEARPLITWDEFETTVKAIPPYKLTQNEVRDKLIVALGEELKIPRTYIGDSTIKHSMYHSTKQALNNPDIQKRIEDLTPEENDRIYRKVIGKLPKE